MNKEKVLVTVSGGVDSTTVLYWAVEKFGKGNVHAVSYHYGSKHNDRELKMAEKNCKLLDVPHQIIHLNFGDWGFKSNLLQNQGDIPEGHYTAENMSSTVVPFRNGIISSITAGIADSKKINKVLLGSHKGDHAIYKDCTYQFTQAMNLAVNLGTDNEVRFESPFNNISKTDIVKIGDIMKIDYKNTWSCYVGKDRPCLKCGTCVERTESFYDNGLVDPLLTQEEWENAVKFMKESLKEDSRL